MKERSQFTHPVIWWGEIFLTCVKNLCRKDTLKRPILQRKNAYFYRTSHGAAIGDLWTSLLESCRLNGVPEFAYLVALGRAGRAVRAAPRDWLPWVWAERQRAAAA